jgi:hypothetical protein
VIGYEEVMGHFGEGNRNNEGRHLLDVYNKWFEKQLSHEITRFGMENGRT